MKKNLTKKTLSLVLALAMTLSLLAGLTSLASAASDSVQKSAQALYSKAQVALKLYSQTKLYNDDDTNPDQREQAVLKDTAGVLSVEATAGDGTPVAGWAGANAYVKLFNAATALKALIDVPATTDAAMKTAMEVIYKSGSEDLIGKLNDSKLLASPAKLTDLLNSATSSYKIINASAPDKQLYTDGTDPSATISGKYNDDLWDKLGKAIAAAKTGWTKAQINKAGADGANWAYASGETYDEFVDVLLNAYMDLKAAQSAFTGSVVIRTLSLNTNINAANAAIKDVKTYTTGNPEAGKYSADKVEAVETAVAVAMYTRDQYDNGYNTKAAVDAAAKDVDNAVTAFKNSYVASTSVPAAVQALLDTAKKQISNFSAYDKLYANDAEKKVGFCGEDEFVALSTVYGALTDVDNPVVYTAGNIAAITDATKKGEFALAYVIKKFDDSRIVSEAELQILKDLNDKALALKDSFTGTEDEAAVKALNDALTKADAALTKGEAVGVTVTFGWQAGAVKDAVDALNTALKAFIKAGWVQDGDTWSYVKEDGTKAIGWLQVGSQWYYFNAEGTMQIGWVKVNNEWFYMSNSQNDGAMKTGWQLIDGVWYYLNPGHGSAVEGWKLINAKWYYFTPGSCAMVANTWVQTDSKWYYLGSNGDMQVGTFTINNVTFNTDANGAWIP